ncbi:MAG: hypothetical protein HY254_10205 [Burkholderiales bacterium]|nr:hypothetical protein [Burkholderiales bacterium]
MRELLVHLFFADLADVSKQLRGSNYATILLSSEKKLKDWVQREQARSFHDWEAIGPCSSHRRNVRRIAMRRMMPEVSGGNICAVDDMHMRRNILRPTIIPLPSSLIVMQDIEIHLAWYVLWRGCAFDLDQDVA